MGAFAEVEVDQVLVRDAGLFGQGLEVLGHVYAERADFVLFARALTDSGPIGRIRLW